MCPLLSGLQDEAPRGRLRFPRNQNPRSQRHPQPKRRAVYRKPPSTRSFRSNRQLAKTPGKDSHHADNHHLPPSEPRTFRGTFRGTTRNTHRTWRHQQRKRQQPHQGRSSYRHVEPHPHGRVASRSSPFAAGWPAGRTERGADAPAPLAPAVLGGAPLLHPVATETAVPLATSREGDDQRRFGRFGGGGPCGVGRRVWVCGTERG